MKQNKIYKFNKNTINIKEYIDNIESIHSVVIIGNTMNLLGTFTKTETEKQNIEGYKYADEVYNYPAPLPNFDLCNSNNNLKIFKQLISNNVEILFICGNEYTKKYWYDIYEYFSISVNKGKDFSNIRMIDFDEVKDKNRYEDEMNNIKNKGKKFDVCIMNPPYGSLGNKILSQTFTISNEILTIQPLNWLITKEGKQIKNITKYVDKWDYSNITSIIGTDYFDAGITGTLGIQHFIKNNKNKEILFDGKEYDKCNEITNYSNDELLVKLKSIIEPLYLKDNLQNHIKSIPNVHVFGNAQEENNPNDNWYIFRITRFSVHPDGKHTNWCIISKNQLRIYKFKDIKNRIEKNGNRFLKYYIPFNNKQTCINIINYIQTDFCRCCLYLVQTSYELGGGECKYIPYFDFSNDIFDKSPVEIDNYLFKKYNISHKIRKHIEELLPDYYNIRKGREN